MSELSAVNRIVCLLMPKQRCHIHTLIGNAIVNHGHRVRFSRIQQRCTLLLSTRIVNAGRVTKQHRHCQTTATVRGVDFLTNLVGTWPRVNFNSFPPFPLSYPSIPNAPCPHPSPNPASVPGEHCKLPQRGPGQSLGR